MKKQILAAALAASMTAGLSGVSVYAADDTFTVGICQLVQHEALDTATQGFKDALTEAFGDKVTFDEQNARAIPTPAPPSSMTSCPTMWI